MAPATRRWNAGTAPSWRGHGHDRRARTSRRPAGASQARAPAGSGAAAAPGTAPQRNGMDAAGGRRPVLAHRLPQGHGPAAWMGSREARRRTTDLVTITARPRWARLLATWAATTCWAMVGYVGCVAALYGVTAQQAAWGGPLWWP